MTDIQYRTGNLFLDPSIRFVAHCCNAQGRMRSGFAKELRQRYSGAYEVYAAEYRANNNSLKMGSVIPYIGTDIVIFNIIGQELYGYDGKRYVSYDALADAFGQLDALAINAGMEELHMPVLGCDLAGGKWSIVSAIISQHSQNYTPVVHLLEGRHISEY